VRAARLEQDARRDPDLADVVEEGAELEALQLAASKPIASPTRSAMSVIQRVCDEVYSSFASSAFASASTVETNVSSRFS
jgi:hypothetical protein